MLAENVEILLCNTYTATTYDRSQTLRPEIILILWCNTTWNRQTLLAQRCTTINPSVYGHQNEGRQRSESSTARRIQTTKEKHKDAPTVVLATVIGFLLRKGGRADFWREWRFLSGASFEHFNPVSCALIGEDKKYYLWGGGIRVWGLGLGFTDYVLGCRSSVLIIKYVASLFYTWSFWVQDFSILLQKYPYQV